MVSRRAASGLERRLRAIADDLAGMREGGGALERHHLNEAARAVRNAERHLRDACRGETETRECKRCLGRGALLDVCCEACSGKGEVAA